MSRPSSLWSDALHRIWKDKVAVLCLGIIVLYTLVAIAAKADWIAHGYDEECGIDWTLVPDEDIDALEELHSDCGVHQPPSKLHWFGTDYLGRDVFLRTVHGSRIALSVGLVSSLIAIPIGVFFGAMAGFFGGRVDEFIVWLYSTIASVPDLLLILAMSFMLGKGIFAVYLAIGLTTWVTLCRLIRAEFLKHKGRDYVVAARALGAGDMRLIFRHILPNVFHIVIINLSLRFVAAIKVEVILSYLGVGAQGEPSWGVMINDAKQELLQGVWWQLGAATAAMFFIVLAFNIFGDALRDALDPKLKQ